jgi:hypothetical protein
LMALRCPKWKGWNLPTYKPRLTIALCPVFEVDP